MPMVEGQTKVKTAYDIDDESDVPIDIVSRACLRVQLYSWGADLWRLAQPVRAIVQWLTEREVIKEDQAARLKKVRAQLDDCLAKTPDVPEVIELLGSSGSYIDYSTCTKVLDALKADGTTVRAACCLSNTMRAPFLVCLHVADSC